MESIKSFIAFSLAALAAYFQPIQDILTAIVWVLMANFMLGLLAGILVNKESFNFRKAFYCIIEAVAFFALLSFVFTIGDKINNREGAIQCISAITYALLYFYGVNIMKNLRRLIPKNKLIAFIYYVVSIEFVDKIPYLKEFLKIEGVTDESK